MKQHHFFFITLSVICILIIPKQTFAQEVLPKVNGGASWQTLNLSGGIYGGDGTTPADVDVTITDYIDFDAETLFINGTDNLVGIGIGSNFLGKLHINNTATAISLFLRNDLATQNSNTYGIINHNNSNTDNIKFGIENIVTHVGEGTRYGIRNTTTQNANSSSAAYGIHNYLTAYGPGVHHALRSSLSLEGDGISLNNAAGYFLVNVSNTTNTSSIHGTRTRVDYMNGNRYGSHIHILTNDDVTSGSVFSSYNLINGDGDREINAVYNDIQNQGTGTKYGVHNNIGSTDGVTYGIHNNLYGSNSNHKYGSYNTLINGTGGSVGYGVYSYEEPNTNNTAIQHGVYSNVSSNGSGVHYGIYTTASGENNFGIYSNSPDASSYAGYFVGRVSSRELIPETDDDYDLGTSSLRWEDVYATNGVIQTSDINDKTSIEDINYGISTVMQMRPISYEWKSNKERGKKLGFIAQDLLEILPEVVKTKDFKTINKRPEKKVIKYEKLDRIGVYYSDIIPVLTKAIQEQQKIIEQQGKQIQYLMEALKLDSNLAEYSFISPEK